MSIEVTKALDFLNDYPVPFIVLEGGKNLASQLNIETMPTSFLLDSNKKIIKMHSGFKSDDIADLESEINKIISSGNNYAENPALSLIRPTYQSSEAHHYVKR